MVRPYLNQHFSAFATSQKLEMSFMYVYIRAGHMNALTVKRVECTRGQHRIQAPPLIRCRKK
jgi:hypothetical protein